ncbi:TolC family protein [Deinococcus hopiensis]|uniref:Outer membrane protein n=1 Tax=Deinococcus hopiensis KR-140 TaxID=695939 RepID=A0A1W1UBH3_9DEIO|nr:TolC family protein [Deinococcus hopiensis]SMB78382.1 outer membrane protein [Deinococcus hopiensis KR-140]
MNEHLTQNHEPQNSDAPTTVQTASSSAVRWRQAVALSLSLTLGSTGLAQTSSPAGELKLEAALAQLAQAPSVTQAQLSVVTAQENLNAARGALGLTVSVTGNASYAGATTTTATDDTTTTAASVAGSAGVNVSLGLLPWSSGQAGLRSAERNLALARARMAETQGAARLNVVQQYLAGVVATQDVILADRTLALRQRQLAVQQAQRENGNATAESVLSAQANVQAAQGAQLQAAANLDAARRSLGAALGTDLSSVTFGSPPETAFALPDVAALTTQARTARREVLEAQNTLASAQEALETQQRDATLPDVTASVRYGPGTGGLSANLNLKQGTVGAGYTLPVGTSSTTSNRLTASLTGTYVIYSPSVKAELSAAQATVTQAQLSLSVAQQTVELDVRTRHSTLQASLIALQSRETQVKVAQASLEAARTRLEAGTGTADDVTVAELNLLEAQRDLLSARATAQTTLIQLQNAAGGAT